MRRSVLVITSLIIIASFGFGETVVSVINSSAPNVVLGDTGYVDVPINVENTEAIGGLQFAIRDVPNVVWVESISATARTQGFSFPFNDSDTTTRVLPFDVSGNSIAIGTGPICTIRFGYTGSISDEIISLMFHEILNADPQFLLVVTDPDGIAMNATWLNGLLTVGGIEVRLSGGGGTPGWVSAPLMIEMNNAVPVKGIQFNIVDNMDYLTLESVRGVNRGEDFTFVGNEVDGQSMVLGVNFNGQEIPPGTGAIVEVSFMIASDAPMEDLSISISNLIVAAEGGLPLPSNGEDYVFPVTVGVDDAAALPTAFELKQNFPNPFNPTTTISYSVPEASEIQVGIFNLLGQEIRLLSWGEHQPGVYNTIWDGLNQNGVRVESGIYIYRMNSSAGFSDTKKLVLLK